MSGADDDEALELDADAGGAGQHGGDDDPPAPADDDEPVGYKRPPRKHQFKPGHSGNRKGRPKGAMGLRKILEKELGQRIRVSDGTKVIGLSKLQIVVKRLVDKAMNGDQRSIEHLVNLNITMFGLGNEDQAEDAPLTPGEEAFLAAFAQRLPVGDEDAGFDGDPEEVGDPDDDENEEMDDGD